MKIILTYSNIFARDLIVEYSRHMATDMEVLPSARVNETLDMIKRGTRPELVVLDAGVTDIKGLSGLSRIIDATQEKIAVAMMGMPTSKAEMHLVLEAGAMGYIPKNIGIKAFYSAVTLMAEGEIFIPTNFSLQKSTNNFVPSDWLTKREQNMLDGLLAGKSNKEIARSYGLSEVTVKHHLKSLRVKLGAKNRTHAVCRAIELGLATEN
jgi:two-component system nitrate/nitrite response regulator NarL